MINYIVCRTPYHLLLASLLMTNDSIKKGETTIFYSASIDNQSQRKILSFLKTNRIIENAINFDDEIIYKAIRHNIFGIFKRNKLIAALPMATSRKQATYYFFVAGIFELALFRHNLHSKFILLEDGEAIYTKFKEYYYKEIIKKILGLGTHAAKYKIASEIWCQDPDRLSGEHKKKLLTKTIRPFLIEENSKAFILAAYGLPFHRAQEKEVNKPNKRILLLTQPWSEDKCISEVKKIECYKKILEIYGPDAEIFIKPHPRESTEYNLHFTYATILPKYFPIEVINYSDLFFDIGVTINSSALYNISIVREKTFIGFDYFPELNAACNAQIVQ